MKIILNHYSEKQGILYCTLSPFWKYSSYLLIAIILWKFRIVCIIISTLLLYCSDRPPEKKSLTSYVFYKQRWRCRVWPALPDVQSHPKLPSRSCSTNIISSRIACILLRTCATFVNPTKVKPKVCLFNCIQV